MFRLHGGRLGITSACAEQTASAISFRPAWTDHLRVCGADRSRFHRREPSVGSPPRVRSGLKAQGGAFPRNGITSACAEQTVVFYCVLSQLNGVEYLIYALRRVS